MVAANRDLDLVPLVGCRVHSYQALDQVFNAYCRLEADRSPRYRPGFQDGGQLPPDANVDQESEHLSDGFFDRVSA